MKAMFKKIVQPAFTLIELVITIVVIGILSAALVATYSDVSGSAKKAAQQASLSALQSQIAIHLAAYPTRRFPTMYDLTQQVANLYIGVPSSTIQNPMFFPLPLGPFKVSSSAPSTNSSPSTVTPNIPAPFFFFIPTSSGAVVLLAFSDPFCSTPVMNPTTIDPMFSVVHFTKSFQPTATMQTPDYSTFTNLPTFDAVVQCVRIPTFAEMSANQALIDSITVMPR